MGVQQGPAGGLPLAKRGDPPEDPIREAKRPRLVQSVDSEAELLSAVLAALEQAPDVSGTSKEMLRRMARGCLCTPVQKRHEFQVAVAEMLRDIFDGVAGDLRRGAADARERTERAEAGKASRHRELRCMRAAVVSCGEAIEDAKREFSEANLALETARRRLDAAVEVRNKTDSKWLEAGGLQSTLATVLKEHFQPLMEGLPEGADPGEHVRQVEAAIARASFEQSLVSAFTTAARKKPSARGSFDRLIFEQMRTSFARHAAELQALARSTPEGAEERAAEVAAAEAALAAARVRQAAGAAALREAEVCDWETEGAVDAAWEALESAEAALATADAGAGEEERALDDFLGGPLAALEVLEAFRGEEEQITADKSAAPSKEQITADKSAAPSKEQISDKSALSKAAMMGSMSEVPTPVRASSA